MMCNFWNDRKLVVVSRAGWIRDETGERFQDNDGQYIDKIARLFGHVVVVGREYIHDVPRVNYQFRFNSPNIKLLVGMDPIAWRHPLRFLLAAWRTIREMVTADIIYCFVNTARGSAYLLFARWLLRKPAIAYSGTDREALLRSEGRPELERALLVGMERLAMRQASARIVTGPRLYKEYNSYPHTAMAAPVSPLLTIRSPPRVGFASKGCARCRILCVSHLRPQKNVESILKACHILVNRGLPIELDIVGDGAHRQILEALARSLGIDSHVRFHGYIAESERLAKFYLENDIFVFASTVEGFPRAIWEAIHFGLYVICVRVGGIETLFGDKDMTILDYPDPELLAEAVARVVCDPRRIAGSAAAAKDKMDRLFPLNPVEQFESALCKAMRG